MIFIHGITDRCFHVSSFCLYILVDLLLCIHSDRREELMNGKKTGINGEEWIVRVRYRNGK